MKKHQITQENDIITIEENQTIVKITTSNNAHDYLIQNIKLESFKKLECFFAIYLNGESEVLDIKTIEKKKKDSDLEIVSQILDFDKNLDVDSLIVFHMPIKNNGIEPQIQIANMLIDKACFACVNVLDYQWLFHKKYYHSMFDHENINFGKHRYAQKRTIKKNEQYTSSTNLQELFEMDVDKLKNIIELEYDKIFNADSFLYFEIIGTDLYKYMELRFRSTLPWNFELPLTKIYLVGIFKDYMKAKDLIIDFINRSNLYDSYLYYRFDNSEYHKRRNLAKVAIEEKPKVPQSKWNQTYEKKQTFCPGQKVVCNRFAEINHKLASGLKLNVIYTVKKIVDCLDCGYPMLVLDGTFDSNITSRICPCGKGDFHPNAFASKRFAVVNLRIKYKNPVPA